MPSGNRKTSTVLYYSAVYAFWSFVITEADPRILEICILVTDEA